jgi:predicted transcriptional regulator
MMTTFTVRLPNPLLDELRAAADADGRPAGNLARRLLERGLRREPSDAVQRPE